jgi:alkanesulfonate monooxygenase SsuD/methylene tetrahydromethanopterin reductase-like flavin-dependent oxidoreductase (luciferase family)
MRFSLDIAPLGDLADPREIARLAAAAEAAGWDAVSTWDVLGTAVDAPAADPFVALAAAATATERVRLITSVVVLPRRRPQLVAQAAATLDRLSAGRLVLGVGAGGDPDDFLAFGEADAHASRVALMDEAIGVVDRLLRGETVSHDGPAYVLDGARVGPRPVQEPRPPIWMGALRAGGVRRAAAWDGWIAVSTAADGRSVALRPDRFGELVEVARSARAARSAESGAAATDDPFEIAVFGQAGLDGVGPADYEAAGATWWLESVSGMRGSVEDLIAIAEAGPPR